MLGKMRKFFREDIAVDQASVHGEDTHHQHDVSAVKGHAEKFVLLASLQWLLPVDHGDSSKSHDESVSEIAEHDGEEEWEGDDGREARIDFLVFGSSISVDDGLEAEREFVRLVVGWRSLRWS